MAMTGTWMDHLGQHDEGGVRGSSAVEGEEMMEQRKAGAGGSQSVGSFDLAE